MQLHNALRTELKVTEDVTERTGDVSEVACGDISEIGVGLRSGTM